jgi:hypothetical protein
MCPFKNPQNLTIPKQDLGYRKTETPFQLASRNNRYFPFPKRSNFLYSTGSGTLPPGVKLPKHEADYKTGFSVRIKNTSSYISMPLAHSRRFSYA